MFFSDSIDLCFPPTSQLLSKIVHSHVAIFLTEMFWCYMQTKTIKCLFPKEPEKKFCRSFVKIQINVLFVHFAEWFAQLGCFWWHTETHSDPQLIVLLYKGYMDLI